MPPTLQKLACSMPISSSDLKVAWDLVLRGIESHMLTPEELPELLQELQAGRDYILDELAFEFLAGRFRVSFLDEKVFVDAARLSSLLQTLHEKQAAELAKP